MPPSITSSEPFENALVIYLNANVGSQEQFEFPTTSLDIAVSCSDVSFTYEILQDKSVLLHNPNGASFTVGWKGRATGTSILGIIKIN